MDQWSAGSSTLECPNFVDIPARWNHANEDIITIPVMTMALSCSNVLSNNVFVSFMAFQYFVWGLVCFMDIKLGEFTIQENQNEKQRRLIKHGWIQLFWKKETTHILFLWYACRRYYRFYCWRYTMKVNEHDRLKALIDGDMKKYSELSYRKFPKPKQELNKEN